MKINQITEGVNPIGARIKAAYQKIYNAGDDAVEFMYYDSPIFAQYWDEYEGDLDSIIAEVDPSELQIILDELEAAAEDQGVAEGSNNAERKIARTQALIQDYYNRSRQTKNDIKRDHYIDMARQLEYELEGMINDANRAEQDSWEVEQHDAEPSATWNRGGLAEGDVVQFPKKHKSDLDSFDDCPKCGRDLMGGTYMGHRVKVCNPCKQVYLPPNSGIDQKGNKVDEQGMAEGEITKTPTGLTHKATDKYGAGEEPFNPRNPGKYARDLDSVNKQQVKDLDASMGITWKNRGTNGVEVDEAEQQKGADYRDPPEADYGDDYQDMVSRVKKLAGLGPLKTVYDPTKRVYKNVPTAVQPKK